MGKLANFEGQNLPGTSGNIPSKFFHELSSYIGIGNWPYFCWDSFFDIWSGMISLSTWCVLFVRLLTFQQCTAKCPWKVVINNMVRIGQSFRAARTSGFGFATAHLPLMSVPAIALPYPDALVKCRIRVCTVVHVR